MSTRLCLYRGPVDARWELEGLARVGGGLSLLGWSTDAGTPEAGVPAAVARVLAGALTRVCRMTFPTSRPIGGPLPAAWSAVAEGQGRSLPVPGLLGRLGRRPRGWLLSTTSPEAVAGLFDDPEFPWWLRGQVALGSPREAAPPALEPEAVLALLDDPPLDPATLNRAGVTLLLRPGVDGDVAGLLALTGETDRRLPPALEAAARAAGLHWETLPDPEAFAARLRRQPPA